MSRFHAETHVNVPPATAFDIFADASRLPKWFPFARKISAASGPLSEAGTTYKLHFLGGFSARCTVMEAERPGVHVRTFALRPFGGYGRARMRFDPEEGGSRVVLDGYWTLPLGALGRVVDRLLKLGPHQAAGEIDRFKPYAEATVPQRESDARAADPAPVARRT